MLLPVYTFFFFSKQPDEEFRSTSLQEVSVKLKRLKNTVLIDLYTNWCHWCKVMDKKTYANQKVTNYLIENFYTANTSVEIRNHPTRADKACNYSSGYHLYHFYATCNKWLRRFSATTILTNEDAKPLLIAGFLAPNKTELFLKIFDH